MTGHNDEQKPDYSDEQGAVRRVDSSTPEGRLWNWLADNWERTWRSNAAQAERIGAVQDLIASAQHAGSATVSVGDLLVALGMDRYYEFTRDEDDN